MEFVSWLLASMFKIGMPLAIFIIITVAASLAFGFMTSPINTFVGTSLWLVVMNYLYRRR